MQNLFRIEKYGGHNIIILLITTTTTVTIVSVYSTFITSTIVVRINLSEVDM